MKALEPFPPIKGVELRGQNVENNYEAAKTFLENNPDTRKPIGTLSKEEWEALTLYQTFAFKKMIDWSHMQIIDKKYKDPFCPSLALKEHSSIE